MHFNILIYYNFTHCLVLTHAGTMGWSETNSMAPPGILLINQTLKGWLFPYQWPLPYPSWDIFLRPGHDPARSGWQCKNSLCDNLFPIFWPLRMRNASIEKKEAPEILRKCSHRSYPPSWWQIWAGSGHQCSFLSLFPGISLKIMPPWASPQPSGSSPWRLWICHAKINESNVFGR